MSCRIICEKRLTTKTTLTAAAAAAATTTTTTNVGNIYRKSKEATYRKFKVISWTETERTVQSRVGWRRVVDGLCNHPWGIELQSVSQ